jgi:hypothetical protein
MTTTKTDAQTVLDTLQDIVRRKDSPQIWAEYCQEIAKQALPAAQRLVDGGSALMAERNLYRAWIAEMAVMSTQGIYRAKAQQLLDDGDAIAYPPTTSEEA